MSRTNSAARLMLLAATGALLVSSPARAHHDPPGCFQTGVSIVVSVFRANGTTGLVGSVSECETINYAARLQKAVDSDDLCAFSGGTFSLTTPDGVNHVIPPTPIPCIGGTDSAEGCTAALDFIESSLIPYSVKESDIVGGLITATVQYTGGVAHDSLNNTPGVAASTPKSTPVVICDDNDLCTTDVCDPLVPGGAACSFPPIQCTDDNACTTEECNPATGICANTGTVTCNDNNACTTESCNPTTGQCDTTNTVQCTDNNACTTESCNPTTGQCDTTNTVQCTDNDACTTASCNPTTGQCETTNTVQCDDNDMCTDDTCNPQTGQCVYTPNDNPECVEAICRTPGFWKTHGTASQTVLTANGGCVEICGEVINTAEANSVGSANSVLEAMCISPRGDQRLQLVRQLTALALNCGVSGFGLDCGGNAGLEALFNDCNAACLSNTGVGDCIGEIDCFNNGGAIDPNTGFCGSSSFNCHEQPLGIPQGSANTPQECNAASKNRCTVILAGEANCTSDTQSCN